MYETLDFNIRIEHDGKLYVWNILTKSIVKFEGASVDFKDLPDGVARDLFDAVSKRIRGDK